MNQPLLHINELERYENGLMSDPERTQFEDDLNQNAALQQELTLYRQLVSGIKNYHRNRLKESLRLLDKKLDRPASAKIIAFNRPFVWLAAACTSLTLAAGLYLYKASQQTNSADILAHYVIDDPGLPVLMSNQFETAQAQAMNYYHTGKYQKAFETWSQIPATALGEDTLHYYKGLFLMKMGEYDSANAYLSPLIQSNSAFSDRAGYYSGLTYWQQQNLEQAKARFLEIKSNPTHTYYDLASEILNEEVFKQQH